MRTERPFTLEATCLDCTGAEVDAFDATARDVTYRTFAEHVDVAAVEAALGYGRDIGLRLRNDWGVCFRKGIFRGRECYVLMWSHIHHFYTNRSEHHAV